MNNSNLILKIHIDITQIIDVEGHDSSVKMILFGGYCNSPLFSGKILPGGVDTQRISTDGTINFSARYILEGKDETGTSCKLFIENTATTIPGEKLITHPRICTDSSRLKWLETADLYGEMCNDDEGFSILIKTRTQA